MTLPNFEQMLSSLVSEHSVSCTDTALDQSNLGVINQLANWLQDLSFQTEVIALPGKPGKANLIATLGGEPLGTPGAITEHSRQRLNSPPASSMPP